MAGAPAGSGGGSSTCCWVGDRMVLGWGVGRCKQGGGGAGTRGEMVGSRQVEGPAGRLAEGPAGRLAERPAGRLAEGPERGLVGLLRDRREGW